MRHRIAGRTLGRSTSHRKAMRRNMAISLFQHEAIRTTVAKAKELRPFVEKLITMARKGTVHARRIVSAELGNRRGRRGDMFVRSDKEEKRLDQGILEKLFNEIAPRYAERPGGYTRIIRLAERRIGDSGKQVLLQLVEQTATEVALPPGASRRERRAARRRAAAQETPAEQTEDQPPAEPAEDQPATDEAPPEAGAADAEQTPAEPADEEEAGGEQKKD